MKYQAGDTIEVVLTTHAAKIMNNHNTIPSMNLNQITKHTPKPFDWSDVKIGMAFKWSRKKDEIVWYIGGHLVDENKVCITTLKDTYGHANGLWTAFKSNLTRAPEHDVEV